MFETYTYIKYCVIDISLDIIVIYLLYFIQN